MKKYNEILNEEIYDDSKVFRKAYDTWLDAMSGMGKALRKEKLNDKPFNKLFQQLEDYFDTL